MSSEYIFGYNAALLDLKHRLGKLELVPLERLLTILESMVKNDEDNRTTDVSSGLNS